MKKILSLMLLVTLLWPGYLQAQEKIYLPLILKTGGITVDNKWRIVTPVASTNYVLNPSGEIAGNFSDIAGATTTRVTTYQKYGLYSYQVAAPAIGDGVSLTLSALTNTEHFVTVKVRGNTNLLATIGSATKTLKFIEKIDDNWSLYGAPFAAAQVSTETALEITAAQPGTFYLDGVQVEPLAYWTTYIDGTQDGCEWLGSEHASISQRSALSKAGGKSVDFWETYKFQVERVVGAGSAPRRLGVDSYAILPGGELNNEKIEPREFTIIGQFIADTEAELHEMSEALESAFFADDLQLTRVRFNGAKVQKEIAVRYGGGLEGDMPVIYCDDRSIDDGNWQKLNKFTQRAAIQLTAPDPYWYEVGESAALLDTNDSATFRIVAARLRSTGQWDALGPPNAAGTYNWIRDIAEDDTYIYFGGSFQNFDNIANADNIVRYNKQTGDYSALGTGTNGEVRVLAIASDGTLYVGGNFAQAGGVANTAYIASWDGSSWSALGTGMNNAVNGIAIGLDGIVYVGGTFTTAGGSAANRIASWDGSSWSALGTGLNLGATSAVIGLDGTLYVGGSFTTAGGSTANYVASWNGSSWSALGTGLSDAVNALAISESGLLYAAGQFVIEVGNQGFAVWNGTSWSALGSGADDVARTVRLAPDGIIYGAGQFTNVGGISVADRFARWNGYTWAHLDIDLPGSPIGYAVLLTNADPVIRQNYDVFIGFSTTGTGNFAGKTSLNNEGSVKIFPKIIYQRSGGTSAIIETLRNEKSGRELLLNYSLLDGEQLTIDLDPERREIISNFFGLRSDAVLANSDLGSWTLWPGIQDITSFVAVSGGPTVTSWILWREAYSSY